MSHVYVVAYGDEIHVYPNDRRECARILYTVAIGANLDAVIGNVRTEKWAALAPTFECPVIDYRDPN